MTEERQPEKKDEVEHDGKPFKTPEEVIIPEEF